MRRRAADAGRRAALLGLAVAISAPASNAISVDLTWTGTTGSGATGGTAIVVSNAVVETLTLDMEITTDSRGLGVAGLSLLFDADLGNELDVISFQELAWNSPMG